MADKLIRRPEVEARTGLARSTIYHWIQREKFPRPIKLSNRLVAWRESDVSAWIEQMQ